VGGPARPPRVEVISVERWIIDERLVPWDTVRLTASLADLNLEEASRELPMQFWLGIPPTLPDRLEAGVTWTDTIGIWQGDALDRRNLGLARHRRVLADPPLAGRRILIVEERAGVSLPRVLHFELRSRETREPGSFHRHQRAVNQELRARSWIDPEAGIYRARWDTLCTVPGPGSFARRIGPDADTLEVSARFDAVREFRVVEPPPPAPADAT